MFSVTIEGETLDDIIIRARGLYQALTGQPAPVVVQPETVPAPSEPETDPPGKKTRRKKAETAAEPSDQAEPDAEQGGDEEFDRVAAAGVKEKALDKIRAVYSLGNEGMEAVKKLGKEYGVKKLGDVPLEKADELLANITKIEKTLAKDAPI